MDVGTFYQIVNTCVNSEKCSNFDYSDAKSLCQKAKLGASEMYRNENQ